MEGLAFALECWFLRTRSWAFGMLFFSRTLCLGLRFVRGVAVNVGTRQLLALAVAVARSLGFSNRDFAIKTILNPKP